MQPVNAISGLAYAVASLAVIRRLANQPRILRVLLAAESAALLAASAGSVKYPRHPTTRCAALAAKECGVDDVVVARVAGSGTTYQQQPRS